MFSRRVALITVLGTVLALDAPSAAGWRVFTAGDGLAGGNVDVIYPETGRRLLWAGTGGGGLSAYDGVSWRTHTQFGDQLAGDTITSIMRDRQDRLWIGTTTGLSRMDGGRWRSFEDDIVLREPVSVILEDAEGSIWVGTGFGVARYRASHWEHWMIPDLPGNRVNAGVVDRDGRVWFATASGIARFDGAWSQYLVGGIFTAILADTHGRIWAAGESQLRRWNGVEWDPVPISGEARTLLEDAFGTIWIGTSSALLRFREEQLEVVDQAPQGVSTLFADRSGEVWAGTGPGKGVTRYDGFTRRTFTTADHLGGNQVTAMAQDGAGNIWIGTGGVNAGLSRFDGEEWTTFGVPPADSIEVDISRREAHAALADRDGVLWFGTLRGVIRYDGDAWRAETTAHGLASDTVWVVVETLDGTLLAGTQRGVDRLVSGSWEPVLRGPRVNAILEDHESTLWFGTEGSGILRLHAGSSWDTLSTDARVRTLIEDDLAVVWAGTNKGIIRFDGDIRTVIRRPDIVSDDIQDLHQDRHGTIWMATGQGIGNTAGLRIRDAVPGLTEPMSFTIHEGDDGSLWFGTKSGVSRHRDGEWVSFGETDGLPGQSVYAIAEDATGRLWFGTGNPDPGKSGGLARFQPDRVGPETVFDPAPPALTGTRRHTFSYAAFAENQGIRYRVSLTEPSGSVLVPWTDWSFLGYWSYETPKDGVYTLHVQTRDLFGNLEESPLAATFEVDATPPPASITRPRPGDPVQGTLRIEGFAADPRFSQYVVETSPDGETWNRLRSGAGPVSAGILAEWNTAGVPDGDYRIRLSVTDTLALTGRAIVSVIVDNEEPYAFQTSPVRVIAGEGGDVYTTGREAHVFIPPGSFEADAVVHVEMLSEEDVPDSLPAGNAVRFAPGFRISFEGAGLKKTGVLDMTVPSGAAHVPVAYVRNADSETWRRLGGTRDPRTERISVPLRAAGDYALFAEEIAPPGGRGGLGAVALAPRILRPGATGSSSGVSISFTLSRAEAVYVRIFNRSGRLVRDVTDGLVLGSGENVVHWDGRDRNGDRVDGGLFFVTVEAGEDVRTATLAVVR